MKQKDFAYLNAYIKDNDNNESKKDVNGWYLANVCFRGALSTDTPKAQLVDEWIKTTLLNF